ncbi:hypothetical protein B0H11DRAFT_2231167 [Mycena galericulata]|nr:hypothetical protein B0H11DRAFT_2231167 [Mycena galericulata]
MTEHIPPVCTLSVGSSDEDCECSDEEDELEDSEDDVRSHRPRPRKAPVKSSLVSAAPVSTARVSPIFISSDSEDGSPAIQQINEDPDADRGAITGTAHANRARGRTPIVISDDEIPGPASGSPRKTQTMRTPAGTSGTPFLALGRDPKLISGNERLLFVRSKRKTKKERDAAAIANVPQLETFFSQIAGTSSARVPLHPALTIPAFTALPSSRWLPLPYTLSLGRVIMFCMQKVLALFALSPFKSRIFAAVHQVHLRRALRSAITTSAVSAGNSNRTQSRTYVGTGFAIPASAFHWSTSGNARFVGK